MTEKLIYESRNSQVYLLEDSEWAFPVIRKTLNSEYPPPDEIKRFYNEFEIISELDLINIRKALRRTRYKRKPALYLEYIEGETVREGFRGKQNDIVDFLYLSIAMTNAIGDIHRHNIIHKDISPQNIIIDIQRRTAKIIDFGISSKLDLKKAHLGNPERLEGNLSYISPEQTGRMNRVVDYRTDLYSLGVIFYEMLTGQLPFLATDAMELVHAHIAQKPEPAHNINENVPRAISDIVGRLLSKNAEDRYQSALGVVHDLTICLEQFEKQREIDNFELGTNDYSGKFRVPQKLFGREKEVTTLMEAFDQASEGDLKMVLVAGYSGTGKTSLVHEIHKPVTEKRGHYIEGKFDQFRRGVPYFAIIQAFRDYVNLLLTENKDTLDSLSEIIQNALGAQGKVLTDVIPNLEHIIGRQPDIPELGGTETQNRFNYVFSLFVQAISNKAHPIVIFIDDLQWADSASLSLLKELMSSTANGYLLCIGAYRDNEVSSSHALIIALREMKESGADIQTIEIGNLSQQDVHALVSESVSSPLEQTVELTKHVYNKTRGNAFFVMQFLKSLYQEQFLKFDFKYKSWHWDIKEIQARNITDNVVELMAGKIQKLPDDTQDALKLAACIGNHFDLNTLAVIRNKEPSALQSDLHESLAEGLVVPLGDNFKFSHDRIQQAVYSLIPESEKSKVHLTIGKLLLEKLQGEQQEEMLFDIANQWNLGRNVIEKQSERELLADVNLKAGIKAKHASAFKPAYQYLETGISLLPDGHWKSHYELSRDLYTESAETAYLNGDFDFMEVKINAVLENTTELLDKVVPYEIRILAYKAENRLLDSINTGIDVLGQLGERFPKNPTMAHVMFDLAKIKIKLAGKDIETLANRSEMTDRRKIAAMRIIADIASSSYWATPTLFPLLIFRMCQLSLKYGNTALSAFGYATYGVIMCGVLGAMRSGYEYGKLGLILLDRFKAREWLTQIYCPIYALIINWNEHVENTLAPLQESYHIGLETGAVEFACINANIYCIHAYLTGRQLEKIESETKAYSESFERYKQETNYNYNEVYHQGMLNFMGQSENPLVLTGSAYDEVKMVAQNLERNDQTGKFFIHFNKLILCYYFRDYQQALVHAEESRKLLEAVLAKFEIPNHHYYESLTLLALYPDADNAKKPGMMKRVRGNIRKMKKWAKDAPENYTHKLKLMQAERLRVIGKHSQARIEYDQAIQGASLNRYLHEEALGYEVTAQFYLSNKLEVLAEFYLKAAYNAYGEWGAIAKLRFLEHRYPEYISSIQHSSSTLNLTTVDSGISTADRSLLDLSTVLKASTAISSEIVLKSLLRKMMRIVSENAGAQSGFLIIERDSQLRVQAKYDVNLDDMIILQDTPVESINDIANSVLQYVYHTKESVVVNDATNDERYSQDPYIVAHAPKSILSLPIINQGKFMGILYLENKLSIGAFTQNRVNLLSLLSGQIAVSLNNAILYENMEQKVEERTEELSKEKQKSDQLLLNILPVETANELKQNGKAVPRRYQNVTVMFTDFTNFSQVSEKLTAEELVDEVDTCFGAFDDIISKHGIEKIKTIGDSYMCAGGIPVENSTHTIDTVEAAIEIRNWMRQHRKRRALQGLPDFDIRIGLHNGPLIAGVVGTRKFAYDVWGETVNIAARMESGSEAGCINISGSTYSVLADEFECTYRGKLPVKNMDDIKMYFVEDRKSA